MQSRPERRWWPGSGLAARGSNSAADHLLRRTRRLRRGLKSPDRHPKPRARRAATAPQKRQGRAAASPSAAALRFKDRFFYNGEDHPMLLACPSCSRIMRLVRTTSRFGDLPDLYTFECRACGVSNVEAAPWTQRRCKMGAESNYKSATTTANGPGEFTAEVLCSPSLYSTISALSPFHQ
jgi:hypothetical protein